MVTLAHFELDPAYGSGSYRRSIHTSLKGDAALVTIDDTHHSMWLVMKHDDDVVISVDAGIERGPATSCGGAPAKLLAIQGLPLTATGKEIATRLPPAANCTHLADMLRWAVSASRRGSAGTDFQVIVPDQVGEPVWIEIRKNGDLAHRWYVDRETILAPSEIAGRPLLKGFLAWAREVFDEAELETALMLQRGAWVARGRRYVVDRSIVALNAATGMKNACHSYSGDNWATATNNIGYVRDYSAKLERPPLPARVRTILGEDHHDAH